MPTINLNFINLQKTNLSVTGGASLTVYPLSAFAAGGKWYLPNVQVAEVPAKGTQTLTLPETETIGVPFRFQLWKNETDPDTQQPQKVVITNFDRIIPNEPTIDEQLLLNGPDNMQPMLMGKSFYTANEPDTSNRAIATLIARDPQFAHMMLVNLGYERPAIVQPGGEPGAPVIIPPQQDNQTFGGLVYWGRNQGGYSLSKGATSKLFSDWFRIDNTVVDGDPPLKVGANQIPNIPASVNKPGRDFIEVPDSGTYLAFFRAGIYWDEHNNEWERQFIEYGEISVQLWNYKPTEKKEVEVGIMGFAVLETDRIGPEKPVSLNGFMMFKATKGEYISAKILGFIAVSNESFTVTSKVDLIGRKDGSDNGLFLLRMDNYHEQKAQQQPPKVTPHPTDTHAPKLVTSYTFPASGFGTGTQNLVMAMPVFASQEIPADGDISIVSNEPYFFSDNDADMFAADDDGTDDVNPGVHIAILQSQIFNDATKAKYIPGQTTGTVYIDTRIDIAQRYGLIAVYFEPVVYSKNTADADPIKSPVTLMGGMPEPTVDVVTLRAGEEPRGLGNYPTAGAMLSVIDPTKVTTPLNKRTIVKRQLISNWRQITVPSKMNYYGVRWYPVIEEWSPNGLGKDRYLSDFPSADQQIANPYWGISQYLADGDNPKAYRLETKLFKKS